MGVCLTSRADPRGDGYCPMPSPHFLLCPTEPMLAAYVAPSLASDTPHADVEALAQRLGLPFLCQRPLPTDAVGLIVSNGGVRLLVPGSRALAWHAGFAPRRVLDGPNDALVRALDLHPGERVLDATLGLGHDAYVLLHAGARVLGVEVHPAVAYFTARGIATASPTLEHAFDVRCARAEDVLADPALPPVDSVYIDPLFPRAATVRNPMWAPLRSVADDTRDLSALVAAAVALARRRVVVKLAPGEPPPMLPHAALPRRVGSKRTQYAVFDCVAP